MTWNRWHTHITIASFALGFYVGLLIVVAAWGDTGFSAAFPNPWRMWVALPGLASLWAYWRTIR